MCGIVGLQGPQEDHWIVAMREAITHRGPDDVGEVRFPEAGLSLAMARLAIIDVETGQQPLTTPDGRYTIVFNGEIYNAPSLRAEMERKGVSFQTDHSDTEVALQLYALEGPSALQRFNGMFGLAIYDRDREELFCARDRLGIKPFYYTFPGGRFAFASELKALLALPIVQRQVNLQSVFHYMSLLYVPGEETILEGISRLPAGHFLIYDVKSGCHTVNQWWKPRFRNTSGRSDADWAAVVREELGKAVQRWTLADVPIGCSLSGGLDSSSIVGLLSQAGHRVRTYSLGFTGPGEKAWNELPLARQVAERWGTEHHELVMDPASLLSDLVLMAWHLDEPYGGGLPSWSVFRHMATDVKVAMTGTGGDELFGNYGKWRQVEGGALRWLTRPEPTFERFRQHFFDTVYYWRDDEKRRYLQTGGGDLEDTARYLFGFYGDPEVAEVRDKQAYMDLGTQLPEEFLMMTDRFSMAHSLEARTPFLDHEFVELVYSIPAAVRTSRRDLKGLLRRAVRELLPPAVVHAPKRGFVIPLGMWLRGQIRPLAERLLSRERLKAQGIFTPSFYDDVVKPHLEGRADYTQRVWAAVMFQLWHVVFMEETTVDRPAFDWKAIVA